MHQKEIKDNIEPNMISMVFNINKEWTMLKYLRRRSRYLFITNKKVWIGAVVIACVIGVYFL